MQDPTIVQYRDGVSARSNAVRMLLFQDAIHLYDPLNNGFIASFPFSGVSLISKNESFAYFSILKDGSQQLEVPTVHASYPELLKRAGYVPHAPGVFVGPLKKLSSLKIPLLLVLLLAIVFGVYYLAVTGISGIGLHLISTKKEAEIGKIIYTSMIGQQKIDKPSTELLQSFASHLRLSERYDLKYVVVDDTLVNAFAIPGGYIVVYKGILRQMKQPAELVALLGHEATHVNERHSLRNMLQELTGGIMLSMVFGNIGSMGEALAGQANTLRSLSYSRSLEEEADEKGMESMLRNNIDPKGMVLLMERLKEAESDLQLPGFLSTHPLTSKRKAKAEAFAQKHPGGGEVSDRMKKEWTALKLLSGSK